MWWLEHPSVVRGSVGRTPLRRSRVACAAACAASGASWHSLIMAYHHVALATRDLAATHRFYTEAMGFTLVKAVVAPTDGPGGWAKHVFYDTGGDGLIAFWDLHDDRFEDFDPRISEGLGLPTWVNHLAFDAARPDRSRGPPRALARHGHRRRGGRPRVLRVDLRHRPQRDPRRVVHRHPAAHRGRPRRGARRARRPPPPSSKPPRCRRSTGVGAPRSRAPVDRTAAPAVPRLLAGPGGRSAARRRPRARRAGQPRRGRRPRHPLDAARRPPGAPPWC